MFTVKFAFLKPLSVVGLEHGPLVSYDALPFYHSSFTEAKQTQPQASFFSLASFSLFGLSSSVSVTAWITLLAEGKEGHNVRNWYFGVHASVTWKQALKHICSTVNQLKLLDSTQIITSWIDKLLTNNLFVILLQTPKLRHHKQDTS